MQLSKELRNAHLQIVATAIDSTNATLNMLTATNEVLVRMRFASPCAIEISNGILVFDVLPEQMVLLTGDVVMAKIVSDNNNVIADISVSDENGFGEIKLSRTSFYQGDLFRLKNWQVN